MTRTAVVAIGVAIVVAAACASDDAADPTIGTAAPVVATSNPPDFEPASSAVTESSRVEPTSAPDTSTTSVATTSTTRPSNSTSLPEPPIHDSSVCSATNSPIWDVRPPSSLPAPPLPAGWTTEEFGTSALGRPLTVLHRPSAAPARTVLVVGGVHGNEPVSPPTVRGFVTAAIPDDVDVWLIPELNADGVAAGTRCNANGVDLNRNFAWAWRSSTGGPGSLSEPEPAAVVGLVERVQPDVVVWVHQPYGYVSSIGATPDAYEQAWAAASGVPVRPDVTQHGGGESWTAFVAERPSMLIEIDTWEASEEIVAAHRAGFEALLAVVVPA